MYTKVLLEGGYLQGKYETHIAISSRHFVNAYSEYLVRPWIVGQNRPTHKNTLNFFKNANSATAFSMRLAYYIFLYQKLKLFVFQKPHWIINDSYEIHWSSKILLILARYFLNIKISRAEIELELSYRNQYKHNANVLNWYLTVILRSLSVVDGGIRI